MVNLSKKELDDLKLQLLELQRYVDDMLDKVYQVEQTIADEQEVELWTKIGKRVK